MTAECVLILALAFIIKHFVVDFPLQVPYHYLNKGTYMHPGGLQHAGLHGLATIAILTYLLQIGHVLASLEMILLMGVLDFVVHYHVDWAKMKLNAKMGWKPDNSEYFWWFLGLDQFLHMLTYLGIIWILMLYPKGF